MELQILTPISCIKSGRRNLNSGGENLTFLSIKYQTNYLTITANQKKVPLVFYQQKLTLIKK